VFETNSKSRRTLLPTLERPPWLGSAVIRWFFPAQVVFDPATQQRR
jgi:hypothetical protein